VLTGVGSLGLVGIVVGTFLPWLASGSARRNSYAAGGAVHRLLTLSRALDDLLRLWPLLGLVAALALAAVVLGHPVVGLSLGMIAAVVAGSCAVAVLTVHPSRYLHVVREGPLTTLAGAMLLALTGLISLGFAFGRRPR
jgi:hypothetical protein